MDTLRTAVSVLSHWDPEVNAPPQDHDANVRKAERLISQMSTAVAAAARIARKQEPVAPRDDLDHAACFLYMINGEEPSEAMAKAFDLSLTLYAEHELNASTFAARVTCLDALGPALGDRLGDRHPEGRRSTAGPTRRPGTSWSGSARPRTPSSGSRTPWTARSGSWASATGSTRPATPGPGS